MVKPPRGRKRRGDLGHGGGHTKREKHRHRPTDANRRGSHGTKSEMKGGNAPGKDANDRKREGVVGKPRKPAVEFLGVSQFGKGRFIGALVVLLNNHAQILYVKRGISSPRKVAFRDWPKSVEPFRICRDSNQA